MLLNRCSRSAIANRETLMPTLRLARLLLFTLTWFGLIRAAEAADEPRPPAKQTLTYKTVGDLPVQLDAYLPDPPSDGPRPVVVHIHGGALIMGSRGPIDATILKGLLDLNFVVVSLDYRLAPETKLPEIISDIEDAFRWLRGPGSKQLQIDPERVGVFGGSAGGYLTLITGYRVQPRPKALVSFFGYGDLVGAWYSERSTHPRHQTSSLSEEMARNLVNGPPVSEGRQRTKNAGPFYNFCRQQGIWPKEVSGWDPKAEVDKFVPYMPLRNVTADYPPTLLIHGTNDTDVPYEQSQLMDEQLTRHGVKHRLITVDGAEHGLAGVDKKLVRDANQAAIEFLRDHLKPR